MKNSIIIVVLLIACFASVSCTDTSIEELEQRNEQPEILQLIDPSDDGQIDDEDHREQW